MDYLLLGPVQARNAVDTVDLGPPEQRALFALLALSEGPVSLHEAVDELWADPPRSATKMVQIYASGLRKALGSDAIRTTRAGYELVRSLDDVDVHRFRGLRGAAAGQDVRRAAETLRQADELWRGDALQDLIAEPFAERERERLNQERAAAIEDRVDAELHAGETVDVEELQALVARHPYRERLRRLLILALYRAGRQADALAAYQDAARVLREELGLQPGAELRDLERAILRQDASLEPDAPHVPATVRGRPRRIRSVLAAGAVVVIAVAAFVFLSPHPSSPRVAANSWAALDPATGD